MLIRAVLDPGLRMWTYRKLVIQGGKKVMEDPLERCEGIDTVGKMGESKDATGQQSRNTGAYGIRGP